MAPKIFLSYARRDEGVADAVIQSAQRRELDVWSDKLIPPGQDWRDSIVDAIRSCDLVLILFSEQSNSSRQMLKELAIADQLGKLVVPVLLEATEPRGPYLYELAWRNWTILHPDPLGRIDALLDRLVSQFGAWSATTAIGSAPTPMTAPSRGSAAVAAIGGAPARFAARPHGAATGGRIERPSVPVTTQPRGVPPAATRRHAPAQVTTPSRGTAADARLGPGPGSSSGQRGSAKTQPSGQDQVQERRLAWTSWWLAGPIMRRDVLVLGPTLGIFSVIGVSVRSGGVFAFNTVMLLGYMLVVVVRSARLNIGVNTWKPFCRYFAIGTLSGLCISVGMFLDGKESTDVANIVADVFATIIMAAMLAGIAILLQFVLRRIFQLKLFKSRIRSAAPIS